MLKPLPSILAAGLAAASLVACTASTPTRAIEENTATKWTGEKFKAELIGNTAISYDPNGPSIWQWVRYFREDGTASAKSYWSGGGERGDATWLIKGDKMCSQWSNPQWGGGEMTCFEYYEEAGRVTSVALDGPDKGVPYRVDIIEGNSHKL